MKVFISWSGEESRLIAKELYDWLPMVVQSIVPFMSTESIEKGTRWASSISNELEGTDVGIVVLTPSNVNAPWINFEAGALAKIVDNTKLAPILFGLKPSEVGNPLSQFQVTGFTSDDILKLLKSINSSAGENALLESRLEKMHNALWNDLYSKIEPLIGEVDDSINKEDNSGSGFAQILEELLLLSRQHAASLHSQEKLLSNYSASAGMESFGTSAFSQTNRESLIYLLTETYDRWNRLKKVSTTVPNRGDPLNFPAYANLSNSIDVLFSEIFELIGDNVGAYVNRKYFADKHSKTRISSANTVSSNKNILEILEKSNQKNKD